MSWDELKELLGERSDSDSLDSVVRIESQEAAILAQWFSIRGDLDFATAAIRYLITLGDSQSDPDLPALAPLLLIRRSLFMAAVIVYARCFAPGTRGRLKPNEVFENHEARKAHAYFIDVRDRHLAHAASPLEEVMIGLHLVPDEDGLLGRNLVVMAAKLSQPRVADLHVLLRLFEHVTKAVELRAIEAHEQLRKHLGRMPLEELEALPPLEMGSREVRIPHTRRERRSLRR